MGWGISYWTLAGLGAVSVRLGGRWHLQRRPGNPTCFAPVLRRALCSETCVPGMGRLSSSYEEDPALIVHGTQEDSDSGRGSDLSALVALVPGFPFVVFAIAVFWKRFSRDRSLSYNINYFYAHILPATWEEMQRGRKREKLGCCVVSFELPILALVAAFLFLGFTVIAGGLYALLCILGKGWVCVTVGVCGTGGATTPPREKTSRHEANKIALALQLAVERKVATPPSPQLGTRPAPSTRCEVQLNPIYAQKPMRDRYISPNGRQAEKSTRRASLESIAAAGQEKWTGLTDYEVCDILARSLSEGRYFVNPAGMATHIFAEDCVFKDPFGVIVGLPGYLATLGIRFDPQHSHVELLDVAVPSPRTITAMWMLGGYLGLPVDSRIYPVFEFVPPFQGWVTYLLNDTGLVVFQEQTWSIIATGPGMETTPMPGAFLPGIDVY